MRLSLLLLAVSCMAETTLDDNLKSAQALSGTQLSMVLEYSGDDAGADIWIGLIPGQAGMINTDMWICYIDSSDSSSNCGDYYSTANQVPSLDSTSNILGSIVE